MRCDGWPPSLEAAMTVSDAARSRAPQSQHMTGTVLHVGFSGHMAQWSKETREASLTSAFLPDPLLVEPSIMVGLGPPFWGTQIIQRSPGMKLSDKLLEEPRTM